MAKQFELLVFDWDGTLMDSAGAIVSSIQAACSDIGIPQPSDAAARHIIGLGLNEAIRALLPDLAEADYGRLVERYRHHFLARDNELPLFPGARETIADLHETGFLLAVATGKTRRGLERAFKTSGLRALFNGSRCADESISKPHPAMLLELMDEFDVTPERTLMIGDTSHDLQMAANAGVASVAVSFGAHSRDSLLELGPLTCVDNWSELKLWLTTHA